MTALSAAFDLLEVRRFLAILHPSGQVFEARIPKAVGVTVNGHPERGGPKTISGFFNDPAKAAEALAKAMSTGRAPGVYATYNAPNPALLARAENRLKVADTTTADRDVPRRTAFYVDADPVRPAGISATDAEKDKARVRIEAVRAFLDGHGFPEPLFVDSGNGFHLSYAADLPGDDGGLIDRLLKALSARFSDDAVSIDTTVSNASRIGKIPGTLAAKGDSTADRPHRMARLLSAPETFRPVPRELIEKVAGPAKTEAPSPKASPAGSFDIDEWVSRHLPHASGPVPYNGGRKWVLDPCPFNADHTGTSSALFQLSGGGFSFKCQHNGCSGRGWNELRELLDPVTQRSRPQVARRAEPQAAETEPGPEPWPDPVPFSSPMDLPEFPIEALPEELADFASELSATVQLSVEAPAAIAIACVAAAAARNFVVAVGETHEEPVNIFTAVVMDAGERKTEMFRRETAPSEDIQKELSESMAPEIARKQAKRAIQDQRLTELTKRAAKEDDVSERARLEEEAGQLATELEEVPAEPELILGDVTPEALVTTMDQQGGRIALFDADSGFFEIAAGRYSGAPNFEAILKAHAGDKIRVKRRLRRDFVERPALTIAICIQPSVAEGLASVPAFKGRGLLARFMWVIPDSRVGTRIYANRPLNPTATAAYSSAIKAVFRLPKAPGDQPHRLVLAGPALNEWATFANRIEREQVDGARLCGMRDWASKAAGLAARIAGLFHILRYRNSHPAGFEIGLEDVVSAVAIADWATDHALCAYGLMEADETVGLAKRLLRWIERTKSNPKIFEKSGDTFAFSVRDCHQHHRAVGKPDDLLPGLEILECRGFIRRIPEPTKKGRGKPPSPRFEIRPLDTIFTEITRIDSVAAKTPSTGNSVNLVNSVSKERFS